MSSSTLEITANRSNASLRKPTGIHVSPVKDSTKPTAASPTKNPKLRKRTQVKKPTTKPPWKTVLSVLVKNLGLLLILILFIQMLRRLAFNQHPLAFDDATVNSDYDRRIADVEAVLKTTLKMMQAQIDLVDRKFEGGIDVLRTEVTKRIHDEHAAAFNKFGEFDARVETVERLVTAAEWLSRDEFDRFVEEFNKGKRGVDDVSEVKLDEIRAFAREIVHKEIGKHAADGLGRVDYAVATGGAKVLKHSEAFNSGGKVKSWFAGNVRSDAVKVLQPSFGQPGDCFPLKGDTGFVDIKLRTAIVPEAITLEHVSKSVAFDISSAPKHCKVFGWLYNDEDTQNEHLLTEFTYDLEKSVAQTFNVLGTKGEDPIVIDTIRIQLMSNHGSPTHTCIYRVRVHGNQPNDS
ncbi:SUN domain-containing protein 1-like [Bidens hawaiensis]|uniref:SUN domain-containing protein 1-like n=1 Tax=Bidens hawaiensis TaxID=980011 RepID=UPI004049F633